MSRFFRQAGDSDSESSESEDELMSSGDEDNAPPKPSAAAKPAMSRFLRTAGSDSSDESSSEESDEESDDDAGGDDDESDEDKPAVRILSAVDKRLKEMEATGKVMENGLKINDWLAVSNGTIMSRLYPSAATFDRCLCRIRQTRSYDPEAAKSL